jgi:uncharacterized protein (DUF342 family)
MIGGLGLKGIDPPLLRKQLKKPHGRPEMVTVVMERAYRALEEAGIIYGIKDDEVQAAALEFLEKIAQKKGDAVAHKVAEGEAPEPGEDAWIEYPLNYRGRPFHELAGLSPRSTRKSIKVVHARDVLATLIAATAPKKGTNVKGESVGSDATPANISLQQVAGRNTEVADNNLLAQCDGVCEEDASGWLRVIPEIVLNGIDQRTGRVPESGITEANVAVIGDVKGGFGVATSETLFVGAAKKGALIEASSAIQAKHLVLHGKAIGEGEARPSPIEVEEFCILTSVTNRSIQAGHILVGGDAQFSKLNAEHDIRIGGALRGGVTQCRQDLQVFGDPGHGSRRQQHDSAATGRRRCLRAPEENGSGAASIQDPTGTDSRRGE